MPGWKGPGITFGKMQGYCVVLQIGFVLKAGLFHIPGDLHSALPGMSVWKLRRKAALSCSGCGGHCAVSKTGPGSQCAAGFPCWAPAEMVWKCLFFSFDNTDCVILCHIKTVEFDPSWLLGVHRKSSWDVPGVTWGV